MIYIKLQKKALELARKKLIKGSVIVFDDYNAKCSPGETLALMETLGLKNSNYIETILIHFYHILFLSNFIKTLRII